MTPLLTSVEMRAADAHAIGTLGLPGRVLMETAGRACAARVLDVLPKGGSVGVVCGTGNNGGDGLVIARVLHLAGIKVETVVLGPQSALTPDAAANQVSLLAAGGSVHHVADEAAASRAVEALRGVGVVVDAIFGTGLSRDVTGVAAAAITAMQTLGPILAVDLPSGLHADTGRALGVAVKANWTVALGALKRAHALVPGADACGDITVVDVGIPVPRDVPCQGYDASDARGWHHPRALGAHKGSAGHVLVVGGSPGMSGAAHLASLGALRAGAGRVTVLKLGDVSTPPEVTTAVVTPEGLEALVSQQRIQALVVGCGLSTADDGKKWLEAALATMLPAVLDAGALTLLGTDLARLRARSSATVLTPHPAELARLLGLSVSDVMGDRVAHALRAATESGAVTIHKGARSVVADRAHAWVCLPGHPVLATGGTGDVLAGVVGALLAKGLGALDAARLGVLLHARAGELLAASQGPEGGLATEVAAHIPHVLAQLEAPL
jgi:hydroxyethylthiazole kinase-like uncharacterized protein yjeF